MKKLVLTLTAVAAFTGSAIAADLPARTYSKAPAMVAPVASWTGCYIGAGAGYGLWQQQNTTYDSTTNPRTQLTGQWDAGGRGYLGTVQAGCDYQFSLASYNLVIGAFGDYDFAGIKGNPVDPAFRAGGQEKLSSQWAIGGRAGVLVTPSLLTYFTAGYTEAKFDAVNIVNNFIGNGPIGAPLGVYAPSQTYKGYFLGAGDEYALSFLPGLFWKTEYRFSNLDTKTNSIRNVGNNALAGVDVDSKKYVHTVRSELTYHFNWGGAVVAKY